jgi:hypothetical protein
MRSIVRTAAAIGLTLGIASALVAVSAGTALAHEERTVGRYSFRVGFGDEPAYAGLKNSVQLLLFTKDDKPVVDMGNGLHVAVVYGDQTLDLSLEPDFEVGEFGTAGDYRAWFIPTQVGDYTFHFTGSIHGQKIDESFSSGPNTFSSVEDPSQVEFPTKEPTAGQVAARLEQEVPRLTSAVDAARAMASDRADSARTVAVVGIVIGAFGLILAIIALVVASRRTRAVPPAPASTSSMSSG